MLGAAHKPGAMPLRPLGLGDIYDAAFKIIRFNPLATVGSAVMVAAVAMLVPVILTAALTWTIGVTYDAADPDADGAAGVIASYSALGFGAFLQSVGLIFVTGMMAHVAAAAAIGKRLSLGEAWAATAGKRWRLIGLSLLLVVLLSVLVGSYALGWVLAIALGNAVAIVLWAVLGIPTFVAALWFVWIRLYYLPVPALMLEDLGVIGSIRRGYRLTSKQFWRTFGIALLTVLIGQVAGSLLALPFTIGGQVGVLTLPTDRTLIVLVVSQALGTVVSAAFTTPFISAVTSLQYLDQRMRKEAYDVDLMGQAGVLR